MQRRTSARHSEVDGQDTASKGPDDVRFQPSPQAPVLVGITTGKPQYPDFQLHDGDR
jgi:hypothetical protein